MSNKLTSKQFDTAALECRSIFEKKLSDYGSAWRIMRPHSITDQIFIKAKRIRSIETNGFTMIDEGVKPELIGIINYSIIGIIQLELGFSDSDDISIEKSLEMYDKFMSEAKNLMTKKNHDYGEAWRSMRIESYTDLILMKIHRTKQIENNDGKTIISEGIDANYYDMINYSIFGLIRLSEKN